MKRRRQSNPAGLGILPVIALTGGLIAAGTAAIAGIWGYEQIGKDMPPPATPPAPAAPQTRADMLTWNPDKLATADAAAWQNWKTTAMDAGAAFSDPPKPPGSTDYTLVAVAGAAALAFVYLSLKD